MGAPSKNPAWGYKRNLINGLKRMVTFNSQRQREWNNVVEHTKKNDNFVLPISPFWIYFLYLHNTMPYVEQKSLSKKALSHVVIWKSNILCNLSVLRILGNSNTCTKVESDHLQNFYSKDWLSPLLLNCVLETVVRIWNSELESQWISPIYLREESGGIKVTWLAFTDDFAILFIFRPTF